MSAASADPYPSIRAVCLEHREEILGLTRLLAGNALDLLPEVLAMIPSD